MAREAEKGISSEMSLKNTSLRQTKGTMSTVLLGKHPQSSIAVVGDEQATRTSSHLSFNKTHNRLEAGGSAGRFVKRELPSGGNAPPQLTTTYLVDTQQVESPEDGTEG